MAHIKKRGRELPDSAFDAKELKIGAEHELEHTDDKEEAKRIAKDHLAEREDYYQKLETCMANPSHLVRTKKDEKIWKHAKKIVSESKGYKEKDFTSQDWGLVNTMFQRLKKNPENCEITVDLVYDAYHRWMKAVIEKSEDLNHHYYVFQTYIDCLPLEDKKEVIKNFKNLNEILVKDFKLNLKKNPKPEGTNTRIIKSPFRETQIYTFVKKAYQNEKNLDTTRKLGPLDLEEIKRRYHDALNKERAREAGYKGAMPPPVPENLKRQNTGMVDLSKFKKKNPKLTLFSFDITDFAEGDTLVWDYRKEKIPSYTEAEIIKLTDKGAKVLFKGSNKKETLDMDILLAATSLTKEV